MASGDYKPVVDSTFTLETIRDAFHARVDSAAQARRRRR